jgi:SAM domain (Sterile alpha motif)
MQQIADWLEKLGLSEYTARFAENGIDISVLRYLTIKISRTSVCCLGIGAKCSRPSVS